MSSAPFAAYDVASCRARIAERNASLHAVLTVVDPPPPAAPPAAGPLAGVPYVLKDTWDTAGVVTTGGSWRHRTRVPETSAHVYDALKAAGAVLLGKSNIGDLAFSTESHNYIAGPVRNPYDLARTAGGSTGGGCAAVADGMAAFDWGTDFGGSIRGPAAWCGVVGLRLSASLWPVEHHHFPRIGPGLWPWCGMGPVTRTVAGARAVVDALRPALVRPFAQAAPAAREPKIDPDRVVIWPPDEAHRDEWPTFVEDAQTALDRAGVGWVVASPRTGAADLPTPSEVNALYTECLVVNFEELLASGELSVSAGTAAVLLGLLSGGRLDRRLHPYTGILLAAVYACRAIYRDKARAADRLASLRERVNAVWSSGALIVSPTTAMKPPRHGHGAFQVRSMSFCKLGNLADGTGLAVPHGSFAGFPALPRSLQVLGPPGSEAAVLDLGARLERLPPPPPSPHSNAVATSIS